MAQWVRHKDTDKQVLEVSDTALGAEAGTTVKQLVNFKFSSNWGESFWTYIADDEYLSSNKFPQSTASGEFSLDLLGLDLFIGKVVVSGDTNFITPINAAKSKFFGLFIEMDGAGGHTVTFGTGFKMTSGITFDNAANALNYIEFVRDCNTFYETNFRKDYI